MSTIVTDYCSLPSITSLMCSRPIASCGCRIIMGLPCANCPSRLFMSELRTQDTPDVATFSNLSRSEKFLLRPNYRWQRYGPVGGTSKSLRCFLPRRLQIRNSVGVYSNVYMRILQAFWNLQLPLSIRLFPCFICGYVSPPSRRVSYPSTSPASC